MNLLAVTILSVASYFLAQILLPGCRFSLRPLISPVNWFLSLYFVLLVLVPLVVLIIGPSDAYLPGLPSDLAMNVAMLLELLAFWSFCCSVHFFRKNRYTILSSPAQRDPNSWLPPIWLILTYAILGVAGIALRFRSAAAVLYYFTDPQWYLLGADLTFGPNAPSKTFWDAAPDFLIYFAPFSMVLLWCRDVALELRTNSVWSQLRRPIYIVVMSGSAALYAYNRASFTIPLIALFAVMLKRRLSINFLGLIALVAALAFLTIKVTSYRATFGAGGQLEIENPFTVDSWLQDYGQAPQYLGYFLESMRYGDTPSMGRIVYHSVLAPLPIIGKSHRYYDGIYTYGEAIGRRDHPPVFVSELYLDFSVFGVVIGFVVIGWCVSSLQDHFNLSTEPVELFAIQFVAICLGYTILLCIEVVVQLGVYLCTPIWCFLIYRAMTRRRDPRASDAVERRLPMRPMRTPQNH